MVGPAPVAPASGSRVLRPDLSTFQTTRPMLRKRHPLFENGGLAVLAFAIFLLVGTRPSEAFLYALLLFAAACGIDYLKQRN